MSSLSGFLKLLFDLSPIFKVERDLSTMIAASVTPVLLIVAIYIRIMETQIDALVSGGKWGRALKDIVLWTTVLGSYYAIGNYLIGLANPIYAWFDGKGSIDLTMQTFSALKAANSKNLDLGSAMTAVLGGSLYVLVTGFLYYVSLAVVSFVSVFLAIAHAILFGVALCWGLIAIPISISERLRILRGWAYLTGLVIAWPIVQGLLTAMFTGLFLNAAQQMQAPHANAVLQLGDLQLLFTILHLVFTAILVTAPFVANALVTNSPSAAAAVTPFVSAAIAAGVATAAASREGGRILRTRVQGAIPAAAAGAIPRARAAPFAGGGLAGTAGATEPGPAPLSNAGASAAPHGASAPDAPGFGVNKARRGAIVNQLRRNRKEMP